MIKSPVGVCILCERQETESEVWLGELGSVLSGAGGVPRFYLLLAQLGHSSAI